jgi:hypothetical protein
VASAARPLPPVSRSTPTATRTATRMSDRRKGLDSCRDADRCQIDSRSIAGPRGIDCCHQFFR